MISSELPIHRQCVDLISAIVDMGKDFPKAYKYSLYDKILSLAVTLLEPLEMANRNVSRRAEYIELFLGRFNTIKSLVRICNEKKLISLKMASRIALMAEEIGKQATAWKNR